MIKRNTERQYLFDFDEHGINQVSEQIMDSYNSGFIDQGTAIANQEDFTQTEG